MTFTFRWPDTIGFIEAPSLEDALVLARYRWCRDYHTYDLNGTKTWYDIVNKATIESNGNFYNP